MCDLYRQRVSVLSISTSFIMLFVASGAYPDGMFFPVGGTQELVSIPSQQAVIQFREGVETLILTSEVGREGNGALSTADAGQPAKEDYVWLLPLPCKPRSIKPMSLVAVNNLLSVTSPEGVVDYWRQAVAACAMLLAAIALFTLPAYRKDSSMLTRGLMRAICLALAFSVLLLLLSVISGVLFQVKAADSRLLDSATLEPYEVKLLRVASLVELQEELSRLGVPPLPDENRSVIDDYIQQDWRFAVVRLTGVAASSASKTPALRLEFESASPVYPMRLTRFSGGDVHLDLIVIADGVVGHSRLQAEYYSSCKEEAYVPWEIHLKGGGNRSKESCAVFRVGGFPQLAIGLPAITGLLWDGCVITRLSGVLRQADMNDDITLTVGKTSGQYRRTIYTRQAAAALSALLGSGLALAIAVIYLLIYGRPEVVTRPRGIPVAIWVFVFVLVPGIAGLACYSVLDKRQILKRRDEPFSQAGLASSLILNLKDDPGIQQSALHEDVLGRIRQNARRCLPPKGYQVEDFFRPMEDERGLVCRVYESRTDERGTFIGRPLDVLILEKGPLSSPR